MPRLSRYLVASDPFATPDSLGPQQVVFSTGSCRMLLLGTALWDRLRVNDFGAIPAEVMTTLRESQFIVDNDADELKGVLESSRAAAASSRTLYECVQPTGFCNLACDYCGQDHRPVRPDLDQQTLLAAHVDRRLASRKYDHLRVGWFGGEPLAAMPIVRALSSDFRRSADQHGCAYSAHVISNGLALTSKVAHDLVDCGVTEIEITLDGPGEAHDRRRPTAHRQPTFARIFANVVSLIEHAVPLEIVIRCNVDRRNVDLVPQLIEQIAKIGKDRVRLYFAPLHDWGNDASSGALPARDYAEREVEWMALMIKRGLSPALLPALKPIVCMAVNPHAELIDPLGQRFNCTEVSLVPAYGAPNIYATGTLQEERRSARAEALASFVDNVEQDRFGCSHCPMLPVCGGACPKQWEDGNTPCPSAKHNLKDRLLLAYAKHRLEAVNHVAAG